MVSQSLAADPGPLARLEDVKRDEGAPAEVFRLLTDPDGPGTLREIAKQWRVPRGKFVQWFTEEHGALYDAALKVRADELAHAALEIADEQEAIEKKDGSTFDPDVPRDRLRVDTRLKLAEKWDRARYGAQVKVEHGGTVAVDAGLLGTIGTLLSAARAKRLPVVLDAVAQGSAQGAVPVQVSAIPPESVRPPAAVEEDLI